MITRFFIYGAMGWCMEVLWTGFGSLLRGDYRLSATTSIWMFFIYGLAVFMEPLVVYLGGEPVILRGGVYVACIFAVEFLTGGLLKKINVCPWDYSDSKYSVYGIIRLDYAPVWFACGLIFEGVHRFLLR